MNALIVLLGCSIDRILYDRINTSLNFAFSKNDTEFTWFLTGGIKNAVNGKHVMSEAQKMGNKIKYYDPYRDDNNSNRKWNYIYDTLSTNTAENLVRVKQILDTTTYDNIYISTSDFHFKRVNEMTQKIMSPEIQIEWILSAEEEPDSRYWENIHIKNVDADVAKALLKIQNRIL